LNDYCSKNEESIASKNENWEDIDARIVCKSSYLKIENQWPKDCFSRDNRFTDKIEN
jgi:hypothetical protein